MVATKYYDDFYYKNEFYAKIGGINRKDINALELQLVTTLDLKTCIPTLGIEIPFLVMTGVLTALREAMNAVSATITNGLVIVHGIVALIVYTTNLLVLFLDRGTA